jgi:hypothetical protein
VDLCAYQKAGIAAALDPEVSTAGHVQGTRWHVADGNINDNAYGHLLVARAVKDTVTTRGRGL